MEKKKATVLKSALAEMAGAAKGISSKDALSAFSRVRLDVVGGHMSLAATDGDVALTRRIECEHEGDFSAAVPGVTLERFVSLLPEGLVEIAPSKSGTQLVLSASGACEFKLDALDASEVPQMKGPGEGAAKIFVRGLILREMMRKVKHAVAAPGSGRKALIGVHMTLKDGKLAMTATDGRRLAHVETENRGAEDGACEFAVILPIKTIDTLFNLLKGCEDAITVVAESQKAASFTSDHWHMTTKAVDEMYPHWEQIVPKDLKHKAKVDRVLFLDALERAAAAEDEGQGVKIALSQGKATFSARNKLSKADAEMACCQIDDGAEAKFTANPRLFKDALSAVDDDEVTIGFGDAPGPMTIKCSIPWIEVIMPYKEA